MRGPVRRDDLLALLSGDPRAGELVVQYQPVVATADAEPLGAEALVRWRRLDGGVVMPDAFVRTAEASGLGTSLDEAVLRRAAQQVLAWDATGIRVHRVGVNLGRSSVMSPDLPRVVERACADAGIGPDRLMLEVVEHEELDLTSAVLDRLQALVDDGVTLAVDDFGAGYASAGLLQALPVGVLKADRVLLPCATRPAARTAPRPGAVLAGVVALAAAAGAEVTAEGAETPEHLALLRDLGVPHVQGWLFAASLDPDALTDHWRAWAAGRAAAQRAAVRTAAQVPAPSA